MTTPEIFQAFNNRLIAALIDSEPPEAFCIIDPNDPIFNEPLNSIYNPLNE